MLCSKLFWIQLCLCGITRSRAFQIVRGKKSGNNGNGQYLSVSASVPYFYYTNIVAYIIHAMRCDAIRYDAMRCIHPKCMSIQKFCLHFYSRLECNAFIIIFQLSTITFFIHMYKWMVLCVFKERKKKKTKTHTKQTLFSFIVHLNSFAASKRQTHNQ